MSRTLKTTILAALFGVAALGGAALASDPPKAAAADAAHAGAGDQGHADAAHAKPNLLGGDIGNAIYTLVIFLTLIFVLSKTAWKPLMAVLEQREQSIRGSLEQAKRERHEAEKLLAQYRQQIDRAREEATSIVEEGKRDAEVVRRRIQEEARAEAEQLIIRASREIQLATDTAVKDLYDRTADLAVQLASNVTRKTLNADDHRRLISESLERVQKSGERV